MDWIFDELDALNANASSALRSLARSVVDDKDVNPYQALATRAKMSTNAKRRVFRVVAAAMARPNGQLFRSALRRLLSFLVEIEEVYCLFSSLISSFLTRAGTPGPEVAT